MAVRLQRVAALTALLAAIELLERIAYRAGVTDAAAAADDTLVELRGVVPLGEDPYDVTVVVDVDDLEAFDASDVVDAHTDCICCRLGTEAGPPPGVPA